MVADAHHVVREGITSMLRTAGGIEVVGQARTAPEAIRHAGALRPDVILLDIRLGDAGGLDLCRALRLQSPRSRVVVLTSYQEEDYLLQSLLAGAWGYLDKTASRDAIVESVISAAHGERILTASVADKLVARYTELAREVERHDSGLGQEELDILELLVKGASPSEIAERSHLTGASLQHKLEGICDKLGVEDTEGAVFEAMRRGLA
jgi:DNA-binding NarL/FixJ family response regulator